MLTEPGQQLLVEVVKLSTPVLHPVAEVSNTPKKTSGTVTFESLVRQSRCEGIDIAACHASAQVSQGVRVLEEMLYHVVLLFRAE